MLPTESRCEQFSTQQCPAVCELLLVSSADFPSAGRANKGFHFCLSQRGTKTGSDPCDCIICQRFTNYGKQILYAKKGGKKDIILPHLTVL